MSRRSLVVLALLALTLASGCGKKADQQAAAGGTTSDSLLSANPVEQPQGQIQPQTGGTPAPQAQQATPAPTPAAGSTPAEKPHASRPAAGNRTPSHSDGGGTSHGSGSGTAPGVTVPAGTNLNVTMGAALSSENAQPGQAWSGTLKEALTIGTAAPFPAGSTVNGVVEGAKPAAKGDRAVLVLRITSIESNGHTHPISATADSIVAGSTRGRNLGAIAGGAAAGALLGKALGGSGKSALIGGILGGAAATGAVASTKGYQATVDAGKDMVFHVDQNTPVKL